MKQGGERRERRVRSGESQPARKRFDPEEHARWQRAVNGRRVVRWVDEFLITDRNR